MADFEDSKIFKVARVTYDAVQMFKSVASKIYDSAINSYTGNAIENKRVVRSAMRSVKEGLKSFKNYISNKTEDLIFDGKEKLGQLRDWGNDKKDTLHYYLLEGQKKGKDLLDTAHYNLLVAGDKVKPLKDLSLKSFKSLQTVGKAGLNGAAMAAGLTGMAAVKGYQVTANAIGKQYQSFMNGAKSVMNRTSARKRLALRNMRQTLNNVGSSISNWFSSKKEKMNSGWVAIKTKTAAKVFAPAVKMFNKTAKNLQIVGKAGVNSAAMVAGLSGMAAIKAHKAVAKAVIKQYQSFMNGAKSVMNRASARKRLAVRNMNNTLQQYKGLFGKYKETARRAIKDMYQTKKGQLKTGWAITKSNVKNSKVVQSVKDFKNKTNAAINNGMFMAGLAKEAAKNKLNTVKKLAGAQYDAFKQGAQVKMEKASALKRLGKMKVSSALKQFSQYKDQAGKSITGWFNTKKGQLKSGLESVKAAYVTKVQAPAAKAFNKTAKNLQIVGKAGLNGAALVGGLAMAGTAKVYESGAKFVEGKYNSAKDTVNKVTSWGREQTTEFKNQAKEVYGNSCKKVGGLFNSVSAKLKETKNKASNQTKGFFNKLGGKISTEMQIAKSKVKNSKVVASAREFADKTNTAINTGMAMAGVAHAAAKKQWNSVKKVTNEKATEFINGANSRIMGGLNMANNVVNNIVNGGKETLTSVGQTLSSAKQGINQGITVAKQAIKEQARGNTASWYRLGQMHVRS